MSYLSSGSFLTRAPLLKGLAEKNASSESDSHLGTFLCISFPFLHNSWREQRCLKVGETLDWRRRLEESCGELFLEAFADSRAKMWPQIERGCPSHLAHLPAEALPFLKVFSERVMQCLTSAWRYCPYGFPRASVSRESACNAGDLVWFLGWEESWEEFLGREDPLEKEMATHSSTLAWRIPWTEEPGGLQTHKRQTWLGN